MGIHPTAIVEDGAQVDGAEIGPYCHVGAAVKLAPGVILNSHVTVAGHTEIGEGTVVYPFAALGGPPQHLGYRNEPTRLVIGARNIIREHVTMNLGTVSGGGVTTVGDDGFFMAASHVAHDCHVGSKVVFANNATIGGHVEVGDHVFIGGLSAVHQFTRIGEHAFVSGMAGVKADLIPFASCSGNHALLVGLNVVGLKRRGFSKEIIRHIRDAYRHIFQGEGLFHERVASLRDGGGDCAEVARIVEFIDAGKDRPVMQAGAATE